MDPQPSSLKQKACSEEAEAAEAVEATAADPALLGLTHDQAAAQALVLSGKNVFVKGKSGVGKTFFLRSTVEALRARGKRVDVVASCSSAAQNAGGSTVHSWLKPLPKEKVFHTREGYEAFKRDLLASARRRFKRESSNWYVVAHKEREERMTGLHVLVIEEVSMLPPELLDIMDATLRAVRGCARPFGGVQLLAVGDPAQLPPVQLKGEPVRYAFETPAWEMARFQSASLVTPMRHANALFVRVLDAVRLGQSLPFSAWPEDLREALLSR